MSSRRYISYIATTVVTALGFTYATNTLADTPSINVMMWGTTWQSSLKNASDDFTKETGIKVNLVTQASSGEGLVKLQTMKSKPTVDVWFTTASVAQNAVEDTTLFATLPTNEMPNLKEMTEGSATKSYTAIYGYPISIVYRTDLVKTPINEWTDLWNKSFEGKIALPAMTIYQGRSLMMASMSHGGSATNADKGFAMLKELKPNVAMFYNSDAQARTALAQGEISVLISPPSQGKRIADAGLPVKVISPKPAIMNFDVATIIHSGKEKLAAQYINFLIGKNINQSLAANLNMAPVNKNAMPSELLKLQLPKEEDKVVLDEQYVNEHIDEWVKRFNSEIAK